MSSFSNISTIRVKYFSSWKSEFVENDQGKYSNLFFRDFQIHKYLNGIFYRLKFISDDFVAQYLSNNNLYVFLNLYMYRFYIYNYVLHFFNVQYLLYDYFFFRFPFVRFYTHYNNEYSYHMNIREFMFLITCSFFNFQLGNFFFKKNFFNVKKINYLNKRSVNFMGFFKYFINIFSSNKFFRKKKISFLRKKKVSFFELFYDKMKDNDNLNYKSNIDIGISIFFIIYLRAILRFCSFLYFFFFTGKSIILYSFFKIYNVICYKLNLVCFFINKFSIYFITSSSGSLKSLLQNYSNDVIFRDYFDDKNYYDFFFFFFFLYLVFSVEKTLFFFTGKYCLFFPNFFFFKRFPPITSSRVIGEYILYELEKGNTIYKVLKSIQYFQFKEMHKVKKVRNSFFQKKFFRSFISKKFSSNSTLFFRRINSNLKKYFLFDLKKYFFFFQNYLNEILYYDLLNKKYPLLGIRIECSGSTKKGRQATLIAYHHVVKNDKLSGKMPYQSVMADVDFYQNFARTRSGSIGIKVWIFFYTKYYDRMYKLISLI